MRAGPVTPLISFFNFHFASPVTPTTSAIACLRRAAAGPVTCQPTADNPGVQLPTAGETFGYVTGNAASGVAPGAGPVGANVPAGARTFASVGEAVAACPAGGVVRVLAGR